MPDNSALIAQLESILQSGVTSITVAGTTTNVDLNVIRQQLENLRATDTSQCVRKPRIATIDNGGLMGGGWAGYRGGCP